MYLTKFIRCRIFSHREWIFYLFQLHFYLFHPFLHLLHLLVSLYIFARENPLIVYLTLIEAV